MGEVSENLLLGRKGAGEGKSILLVDGFQVSSARPSARGSVSVKGLGWLEAVALDRDRGILIFRIEIELYN